VHVTAALVSLRDFLAAIFLFVIPACTVGGWGGVQSQTHQIIKWLQKNCKAVGRGGRQLASGNCEIIFSARLHDWGTLSLVCFGRP
jgi:hypothetical protein